MEKRIEKLIINRSGGTAGTNSYSYRVTLPNQWITALGLNKDNRQLELRFDGNEIVISPQKSLTDYAKAHSSDDLYSLDFYKDDMLCTKILANYSTQEVLIENEPVDMIYLAFGQNKNPSWHDYLDFLLERCIPSSRSGLRYYLGAIGIESFDPLQIILKTKGRMAEDHHRLEVKKL